VPSAPCSCSQPWQLHADAGDAQGGRPWSLTNLREKLIKIGAKVVNHGRYVTFQLAEAAVPRQMFAGNPVVDRAAARATRGCMRVAGLMRKGPRGVVRLDAGKSACFRAWARPAGGFDCQPRTLLAIYRCRRRQKGRYWPKPIGNPRVG
jgi:hypothetical protein